MKNFFVLVSAREDASEAIECDCNCQDSPAPGGAGVDDWVVALQRIAGWKCVNKHVFSFERVVVWCVCLGGGLIVD